MDVPRLSTSQVSLNWQMSPPTNGLSTTFSLNRPPSLAKAVIDRFKELRRQSYVTANPDLKFCPHPSCTETISCSGGRGSSLLTEVPVVTCAQSHSFCFGCGFDSDHRPLICPLISSWIKNAREDAGTSQWIKANTRSCPKCRNNIEKNGGCK